MDPSGNQVMSTDVYSNPIHQHGTAGHVDHNIGGYGDHHCNTDHVDHNIGGYGDQHCNTGSYGDHHGTACHDDHHTGGYGEHGTGSNQLHGDRLAPGLLRRSGSSRSSSSEDDELGGRRKKNKGIKDKIKEKLPGGHKYDHNPQQHYDQGVPAAAQTHGKKGIMEKIKEKLPGSHSH